MPMLTFYATVLIALAVETFATLILGLSSTMERTIARKQVNWDREMTMSHLALTLRIALRFGLGILLAVRIVQLTG